MFSFFSTSDVDTPSIKNIEDNEPLIVGLEETPAPISSTSTEESILPWRQYDETFFEWAGTEISMKLDDLGVSDKIEKIKQETTSFLGCGAPRK